MLSVSLLPWNRSVGHRHTRMQSGSARETLSLSLPPPPSSLSLSPSLPPLSHSLTHARTHTHSEVQHVKPVLSPSLSLSLSHTHTDTHTQTHTHTHTHTHSEDTQQTGAGGVGGYIERYTLTARNLRNAESHLKCFIHCKRQSHSDGVHKPQPLKRKETHTLTRGLEPTSSAPQPNGRAAGSKRLKGQYRHTRLSQSSGAVSESRGDRPGFPCP